MIGIFDSGVGGLAVLQAIRKRASKADIVYFGDTANAPYGPKSKSEIADLIGMTLRYLHAAGCTQIVSACNSASVSVHAVPIDLLRLHVFDVIEMVEPTVAALAPRKKKIAVLGTEATIRSGIYQDAFQKGGTQIVPIAVPALAGLIESGASQGEIKAAVREAVESALKNSAEIISLSCTHYPFVADVFAECLKDQRSTIELFDPADAVAQEVIKRFSIEGTGKLQFLISKESSVFSSYVAELFGGTDYSIEVAPPVYHVLKTV